MSTTRLTADMKHSLEMRLADLGDRIATLDMQRDGDDNVDTTALMIQLTRERAQIIDALRDVHLIDEDPFDLEAIEVGDLVTVLSGEGEIESYVLVDDGVGTRASSDWVSVTSPLGSAILGRAKNDRVAVQSPQGPLEYVIVDFERVSQGSCVGSGSDDEAEHRHVPSESFLG